MRKGQITIFVIIGLVVLLLVGLFILRSTPPVPQTPGAQEASAKVTALIQSCLAQQGEESLRVIGNQGGYADIRRFKDTPDVRETQIITFDPQKTVLWHEVHACSQSAVGCIGNNQPPLCNKDSPCPVQYQGIDTALPSIEEELERHTAEHLTSCLDLTQFGDLIVTFSGEPQVDAIIREESIALTATYETEIITADNENVRLNTYSTTLPVKLPRIYRLATQVHQTQMQSAFLEEAFLHLLAIYSGVDTPIPPIRDVELFGASKFWVRHNVQTLIEQDILPFMSFMQLYNTEKSFAPILPPETTDPKYAPYATGAYQYLIIKLDDVVYPLSSSFTYPMTPMYLNINNKEILKPEKLSGVGGFLAKLAGMSFTQYKFKYDVAFPMLFTIEDEEAFGGTGYAFTFGLEANIVNNYPLNASVVFSQISQSSGLDIANPLQLVDHTYTVLAKDRRSGEPIVGAAVTYECGARFQAGITGSDGSWAGKLPYCLTGGVLLIEEFQYLATGQQITNTEDDGAETRMSFSLWPRKEKTILLYKRSPTDISLLSNGGITEQTSSQYRTPLQSNEFAFFTISRQKETPYEDDVPISEILQFGQTGIGTDPTQALTQLEDLYRQGYLTEEEYRFAIEGLSGTEISERPAGFVEIQRAGLVPGTYDLEGTLMYHGLVQIAPKIESKYTINGTNFTSWVSGGALLTGADALVLTSEQVYSDAPLILYILEQPLPRTWDDIEQYQTIEEYQTYDRRQMVRPTA